ncbi:imelysin family protein [Pseudoponticoccus marisrubri]|uniref:Signal peptidase n=1 Tax=Pseudoponticoccus marisrubri TaxID=1685382 RepID=A0A0W7WQL8_9RHOB|nr:imelysin family protein [Pseudoponticoccus marisrubri]KUF12804.1 signal peptidase [Pseudoponticoccus marisrubri]
MRHLSLVACLAALLAGPATAGTDDALDRHVLPAMETFAEETADLSRTAAAGCGAEALRPAYHAAFDAWMGISHLRFGPLETGGRALAIGFWPDTRGFVARSVNGLLQDADPVVSDPEGFAEVSVAGRGLFALERLLFEGDEVLADDSYACAYIRAVATDLARTGQALQADWSDHAALMRSAGEDGNTVYLSPREAEQALYTALITGLEFTGDQRLGRPLGTFDRPRPTRAEARRSGRSLRNVGLSLEALRGLARSLSDVPIPQTEAAFADALSVAEGLDDPVLADPAGRLKVEILQQRVELVKTAVAAEIGAALGLSTGFNATDGD